MEIKEINALYEQCRTYRRFRQTPLDHDFLVSLVETAHRRSSGRNGQPWHYYLVETPETVAALQPYMHWAAALPKEIGTPKPGEQPVSYLIMAQEKNANPFCYVDAGIAFDTIAFLAISKGIGTALLAAINRAKIAEILKVPDNQEVTFAIGLGYPAHKSTIVPVGTDGNLDYYVDEKRDYYVPKKSLKEVLVLK